MKHPSAIILVLLILLSCSKDRDLPDLMKPPDAPNDTTGLQVNYGIIRINELVAKGSSLINEFGLTSDWLELYNNSQNSITLQAGLWSITDNPSIPDKFIIPSFTLNPGEFKVIFCNDSLNGMSQIHTGFGLSSNGERLGIYYNNNGTFVPVDTLSFGIQINDNMSVARIPDGSDNIQYPVTPSPGASNQ